jgi:hypothetical protein
MRRRYDDMPPASKPFSAAPWLVVLCIVLALALVSSIDNNCI